MTQERVTPFDPLEFIRHCVVEKKIFWTYHVNMRMRDRFIPSEIVLASHTNFEVIEIPEKQKYLPGADLSDWELKSSIISDRFFIKLPQWTGSYQLKVEQAQIRTLKNLRKIHICPFWLFLFFLNLFGQGV